MRTRSVQGEMGMHRTALTRTKSTRVEDKTSAGKEYASDVEWDTYLN